MAAMLVPEAELVLMGYGVLEPELRAAAADPASGGRVHVMAAVPPQDLHAWVASADVAAMAIQALHAEPPPTTPNKLFEAMAAAVPVVSADLPGMATIVREVDFGRLCDPADPASIAEAIRSLLAAPRTRLRAIAPMPGGRPTSATTGRPRPTCSSPSTRGSPARRGERGHGPMTSGRTGRAVVLGNPAAPYSRGLRIARALASAGYAVEIAAVASPGLLDEERDGDVLIRPLSPSGWLRPVAARHTGVSAVRAAGAEGAPEAASAAAGRASQGQAVTLPRRIRNVIVARSRAVAMVVPRWFLLAAHRSRVVAGARPRARPGRRLPCVRQPRDRAGAGGPRPRWEGGPPQHRHLRRHRQRRRGQQHARCGFARRLNTRREAGWARAADGLVTVNEGLAERLGARWQLASPCWSAELARRAVPAAAEGSAPPDRIRQATGLPSTTRIVLFQGRLGPNLELEEGAEAVLRVRRRVRAHRVRALARREPRPRPRPRFAGRHFTLPAVHPDEPSPGPRRPTSAGATAAGVREPAPVHAEQVLGVHLGGTPVVIGPGLELMERLVREHELGAVAASLAADDLARALASVLDVAPEEARARRSRIAALAAERFSWGSAAASYLELVARRARTADVAD
ncbi:MAG: glycosyltransferase family 4 protein [Chloroflexota bacterium]